jgi:hypothetical protein
MDATSAQDDAFAKAMAELARQMADAMRREGDTRQLLTMALERQGATTNTDEGATV